MSCFSVMVLSRVRMPVGRRRIPLRWVSYPRWCWVCLRTLFITLQSLSHTSIRKYFVIITLSLLSHQFVFWRKNFFLEKLFCYYHSDFVSNPSKSHLNIHRWIMCLYDFDMRKFCWAVFTLWPNSIFVSLSSPSILTQFWNYMYLTIKKLVNQ